MGYTEPYTCNEMRSIKCYPFLCRPPPIIQWSFGITCWEVFSGGKTPYPGVDPLSLVRILDSGERMETPINAACPEEM